MRPLGPDDTQSALRNVDVGREVHAVLRHTDEPDHVNVFVGTVGNATTDRRGRREVEFTEVGDPFGTPLCLPLRHDACLEVLYVEVRQGATPAPPPDTPHCDALHTQPSPAEPIAPAHRGKPARAATKQPARTTEQSARTAARAADMTAAVRKGHVAKLHAIRQCFEELGPERESLPIDVDIAHYISRQRVLRKWLWPTVARHTATIVGALASLPLYAPAANAILGVGDWPRNKVLQAIAKRLGTINGARQPARVRGHQTLCAMAEANATEKQLLQWSRHSKVDLLRQYL